MAVDGIDRPVDVGIIDVDFYVPKLFVDQAELEEYDLQEAHASGDGVWKPGKYTSGLGQVAMSFVSDREDVNSLCLTALHRLLKRRGIHPSEIGSLEVGTETLVDKSKSVKTVLMQLFEGCSNVNGIDTTNACFGGTQALFNAVNWIESSSWDGRYAVVVTGDIAVYGDRSARCTGGAGSMAILVGPNAALVFDTGLRAFHMAHTYDFYKPNMFSEYPVVDGPATIGSFLDAIGKCYHAYSEQFRQRTGADLDQDVFSGLLFHTPYCKLIQKAVALISFLVSKDLPEQLKKYRSVPIKELALDTQFFKAMYPVSSPLFEACTLPSLLFAKQMGNVYTSSLYACLLSHVLCNKNATPGSKVLLFSYGSGLASAMFSLTISKTVGRFDLLKDNVMHSLGLLDSRQRSTPERYMEHMRQREAAYSKAPYEPLSSSADLPLDTYYLDRVDDKFRRFYLLKSE